MQETLKSTVAEFLGIESSAVTPSLPLAGTALDGSLGWSLLDAAIRRRTGTHIKDIRRNKTYGDLEAAAMGRSATEPNVVEATQDTNPPRLSSEANRSHAEAPGHAALRCGIDVEAIDKMPLVPDYWEDEFYKAHFSAAEIAYCSMKDDPKVHLAGRWCAKEALKKCDPAFLDTPMTSIETVAGPSGEPRLRRVSDGPNRYLPHALSISHAGGFAIAVVVLGPPAAPLHAPPAAPSPHPAPATVALAGPTTRLFNLLACALSAAAFLVAISAWLVSLHRYWR